MKIGLEYIKYRWKAKKRHGIHSPFVYDLTDKCLQQLIDEPSKVKLQALFSKLKNDHRLLTISDFGAGSKKLSNQRKVSEIYRTSSSKGKYGQLLYQISRHYQPENILEFGTSLGIGTSYLHLGNRSASITTVEACEQTRGIALENFNELETKAINSLHLTFKEFLEEPPNTKFDLVFVDGHHDGGALMDYLVQLKAITHNDTMFVLDDIRWSDSMLNSWNKVVSSPDYHVTLDFFRFGIALPRQQQEKEHFILKH